MAKKNRVRKITLGGVQFTEPSKNIAIHFSSKAGKKLKTDFLCATKQAQLSTLLLENGKASITLDMSEEDLKGLIKYFRKRIKEMKSMKKFDGYFVHANPELSFFIKRK